MSKYRKPIIKTRLTALILLFAIALVSLASCVPRYDPTPKSKDEITAEIGATLEHDRYSHGYVADYLYSWGLTNFDIYKLYWAEKVFQSHYNFEGGLPETLEHARITAENYLLYYYDKIDQSDKTAVTDAVVSLYVTAIGDPYSIYRAPEAYEDYDAEMSGSFGGVGLTLEYNSVEVTFKVTKVHEGGPADKVGIKEGDFIQAVDGRKVSELGYDALNKLRGTIGDPVDIEVLRGSETISVTAIRELVVVNSVNYELSDDKIGYIEITEFKDNTYKQFVFAIDYMEKMGAKGIVFDLRNNPGGYLATVVDMISYLIPSDLTVVSYQFKGEDTEVLRSSGDIKNTDGSYSDHVLKIPVAVICNEYTASAGEIFTSAIRDYRNSGVMDAVLVGNTTYGKGIMQSLATYHDGSALTFTSAYYAPPCGENYHGVGVEPDYIVPVGEDSDLQYEFALEKLIGLTESK